MAKEFDITNHRPESDGMSEKELTKMITEPSWLDVPLVKFEELKKQRDKEDEEIEEKQRAYERQFEQKKDLRMLNNDPVQYVNSKIELYDSEPKKELTNVQKLTNSFKEAEQKGLLKKRSFNPTDPTNWNKKVPEILEERSVYEQEFKKLGLPTDIQKRLNRKNGNITKNLTGWDFIRSTAKTRDEILDVKRILFKDYNKSGGRGMKKEDLQFIGKWVDPSSKKQEETKPAPTPIIDFKPTTTEDIKKIIQDRIEKTKRKTRGGIDNIIDDAIFNLKNPWLSGGSDE